MDIENNERTTRIRELNDAFRRTFLGGRVMLTCGIDALPDAIKVNVLQLVRAFKEFDEGNDPHGEHDFGSFDLQGQRFFWKIDCYDEQCNFGSEDPADPKRTTRVLTIMLANEY